MAPALVVLSHGRARSHMSRCEKGSATASSVLAAESRAQRRSAGGASTPECRCTRALADDDGEGHAPSGAGGRNGCRTSPRSSFAIPVLVVSGLAAFGQRRLQTLVRSGCFINAGALAGAVVVTRWRLTVHGLGWTDFDHCRPQKRAGRGVQRKGAQAVCGHRLRGSRRGAGDRASERDRGRAADGAGPHVGEHCRSELHGGRPGLRQSADRSH